MLLITRVARQPEFASLGKPDDGLDVEADIEARFRLAVPSRKRFVFGGLHVQIQIQIQIQVMPIVIGFLAIIKFVSTFLSTRCSKRLEIP
jgi:hypothetical protein